MAVMVVLAVSAVPGSVVCPVPVWPVPMAVPAVRAVSVATHPVVPPVLAVTVVAAVRPARVVPDCSMVVSAVTPVTVVAAG
jgi:hypothetical protein